jgi:hypothetical protein
MIITASNQLETEAEKIQSFCEVTMSEDMAEAVMRGNDLIVYIARTGKMLADAKHHLNTAKKSDIVKLIKELSEQKFSATVQNKLVESVCANEQYLVDWIERINRTCVHQLDWCRSILSKGKEEMRLNVYGNQSINNKN